jgi:hypothetical protein
MASREELLQSINPGMKLDKNFFLRIYGYEISYPGFAQIALDKLKAAGCSKAGEYYIKITSEYEAGREAKMKIAAAWYAAELKKKEGERPRNQDAEQLLQRKRELLLRKKSLL